MRDYVKFTAADDTVHLCHADSPTLFDNINKIKRQKPIPGSIYDFRERVEKRRR